MLSEVVWPVTSGHLRPRDGYPLFAALCRAGLLFHGQPDTQVRVGRGAIAVRAPADRAWRLAGSGVAALDVAGRKVALAPPTVRDLVPHPRLWAWLVTIKPYMEPGVFGEAARRQLDRVAPAAVLDVGPRCVIPVAGAHVVGFGVWVSGLSPDDSLAVQSRGLGGKQRMGCGVFVPC